MKKLHPIGFTVLAELKVDWKRVYKRIPLTYRGYLNTIDIQEIGLFSSDYNLPVLAIPHPEYAILNKHIQLLNSISSAVNTQLVHKVSGVKFIKPLEGQLKEVVYNLIETFDAEILDVN